MEHSWRIQGNICPICSTSHFPFCPPFPRHDFDPNRAPINIPQPASQLPPDPYYDPGHWNRNPNLPDFVTPTRNPPIHGYGDTGFVGNENDRSSKRLRVDGVPYGGEDIKRRLRLVRDHGLSNYYTGYNVDRNSDGPGNPGNVGYGVDYHQKHGSYMGNKMFADPEPRPPFYGNAPDNQSIGYHHSNYGSSHVSKDGFYGNKFEPGPIENGSLHYDYEQRSNMPMPTHYSSKDSFFPNTIQQPGQMGYDYRSPSHLNDVRMPLESRSRPIEGYQGSFSNQSVPMQPHYGHIHTDNQGDHGHGHGNSMGHWRGFEARPPLPPSPPPPQPMEPPGHWSADPKPPSSPPRVSSSLFPIAVSSSGAGQPSYAAVTESHVRAHSHSHSSQIPHPPIGLFHRDSQASFASSGNYHGECQPFSSKNNLPDKSQIIDASRLFKPPHRASRPDHFVIILRGLPGSGKSYLAKMLRDLEVEHGGNAPRIHSMDDYFMTEVEKAEESDASKSSIRGKKPTMKKVLEYCYEPEMEEAYRTSMLKAFKKTLEEGVFTFVIVDDRNLRVADFAQFWATAKRSGYEVYILEAPYKDPAGCTARNVHGFTHDEVGKMAAQWEEVPSLYLRLNIKSLFHGDDLKESNIQEVDMDTEDEDCDGNVSRMERELEKVVPSSGQDFRHDELQKDESSSDAEGDNPIEVKNLGRSKWSDNLDDEDNEKAESLKGRPNVLSGLLKTYGKGGKSVHWGDQVGHTGFSIGAMKKANIVSLVMGPGSGYNLKTNPLPEEEAQAASNSGEIKRHSVFNERLRAEQESFRAVFDNKRRQRQRIGGLATEEE